MSSSVTFEIERVVEAFLTKRTQVTFYIAVIFHVSVHQTLKFERFMAYFAFVLILRIVDYFNGYLNKNR